MLKSFITDILLVIKCALEYNIKIKTIINRIKSFKLVNKRMTIINTKENIIIINRNNITLNIIIVSIFLMYKITKEYSNIEYINVGTWRKNIGINDGKDQRRDAKKIKSIEKANELFNINLPLEFTSGGNYKPCGSDDISDAINLYSSTRDKYKVKLKSFGKGVK